MFVAMLRLRHAVGTRRPLPRLDTHQGSGADDCKAVIADFSHANHVDLHVALAVFLVSNGLDLQVCEELMRICMSPWLYNS